MRLPMVAAKMSIRSHNFGEEIRVAGIRYRIVVDEKNGEARLERVSIRWAPVYRIKDLVVDKNATETI